MPRRLGSILLALLVATGTAKAAERLRIGGEGNASKTLAEGCPDAATFDATGLIRRKLELVILCNAFRRAGREPVLEFVDQPNYARSLAETVAGRLDMPSQTVWSTDLAGHPAELVASPPVIRVGEMASGLFTTADRADVLATTDPAQLTRLVAAVPRNWAVDWRAMETVPLRRLVDVQDDRIWQLISQRRFDVSVYAFSPDPDFGWDQDGAPRILPIHGLKLALPASRHFVVSSRMPGAEALMADLSRGLESLRRDGTLARLLESSGVLDPRVRGWQAVNRLPETIETRAGCRGGSGETKAC